MSSRFRIAENYSEYYSRVRSGIQSSLAVRPLSYLDFGIHGVNQRFDVAVAEGVGLQFAGIIRMTRHVIGTDRHAELRVAKDTHDLQKVHFAA